MKFGPPRDPPAAAVELNTDRARPVEGRLVLIGRRPGSDIQLVEDAVSNSHAAIFAVGGKWHVRDFDSRTGTYVNDQKVHRGALKFGDVVRIGRNEIRFLDAADVGHLDELEQLIGTAPLIPEAAEAGREATAASDAEQHLAAVDALPISIDAPPVDETSADLPLSLPPAAEAPEALIPLDPAGPAGDDGLAFEDEPASAEVAVPASAPAFDLGLRPEGAAHEEPPAVQPPSEVPAAPPEMPAGEPSLADIDLPAEPALEDAGGTAILPAEPAEPVVPPRIAASIVEELPPPAAEPPPLGRAIPTPQPVAPAAGEDLTAFGFRDEAGAEVPPEAADELEDDSFGLQRRGWRLRRRPRPRQSNRTIFRPRRPTRCAPPPRTSPRPLAKTPRRRLPWSRPPPRFTKCPRRLPRRHRKSCRRLKKRRRSSWQHRAISTPRQPTLSLTPPRRRTRDLLCRCPRTKPSHRSTWMRWGRRTRMRRSSRLPSICRPPPW